ncbi:PAS domain S-box protein [Clostridium frigidicarnis]|uniref:histidine kinase n=1 Tax=Clostridium frigidicarnis TaxID=84698 RepID=A0A1I1AIE4_9CLOT|nr:PAS domain S-box protein [Clostridium frigidicarnis]SFB36268.1 PAS domain S-box-containing protein [Clostridium frigidicarnis]
MQKEINSSMVSNINFDKKIKKCSRIVFILLILSCIVSIALLKESLIIKRNFFWIKAANIGILINVLSIYIYLIKYNNLKSFLFFGVNGVVLLTQECVEIIVAEKLFSSFQGIKIYNKVYLLTRLIIFGYLFSVYIFKKFNYKYSVRQKATILILHFVGQALLGTFIAEILVYRLNRIHMQILIFLTLMYFIGYIYIYKLKYRESDDSFNCINEYGGVIIALSLLSYFIFKGNVTVITGICLLCGLFCYTLYFIGCLINLEAIKSNLYDFVSKSIKDLQVFKLYKSIVDLVPRGIVISNICGEVLYFNDVALEILQCRKNNLLNKNLFDILKEKTDDAMKIDNIIKKLETTSLWEGEISIYKKTNEKIIKCEVIKLIEFNGSKAIVSIIDDITYTKKKADKISKSEKKLRCITDSMSDFIINIDNEGNIRYISTSFCERFGMTYKKLRGTKIYDYIYEDELGKVKGFINRKLHDDNNESKIEYRLKVDENRYIWVESMMNSVRDEYGKAHGIVITSRDINERKYFENELIKSERKYKDFFNMVNIYIYVVDLKTLKIIDINDCMKNEFNLNKQITLQEIFEEGPLNLHTKCFEKICQEKCVLEFECTTSKLIGEEADLEVSLSPLYEDNKVVQIICSAKDISHRKKMLKLEERHVEDKRKLDYALECDRLKTEFLANISHELRTPINVIFAAIQMEEKRRENSKEDYKYIKLMKQNSYRLLRLINNLIDVTKIEAGYLPVHFAMADIIRVIEDITMSVVEYARNKNITVVFDTELEELFISIDLDKIERIIMNLLSNSIKFTPSGGFIYVYIRTNDNEVVISVRDTGRGIPQDKLDTIFDRFTQVDKSLTRDHEGSGIGLYLVKLLIDMHKGSIEVKSELDKGSEFLVRLPINMVEEEKKIVSKEVNSYVQKISIEFSDIYDIN